MIRLRDFRAEDLDDYAKWLAPGQEWQRWDGPYFGPPMLESIREHIAAVREGVETGNWEEHRWRVVIADDDSDRLMGVVSRYWISEESNWLAVGIDLYDPQSWGKGIGTEALRRWCSYLFVDFPEIERLDLRTWSGNERMMRLAERLGFKLEARFRNARRVEGKRYDALGYGILRSEWTG